MNTQLMFTRSTLRLLALLGLTLFVSPVAAQIFDSGPSDSTLFDNVINLPSDPNFGNEQSVGGDGSTTQLNIAGGSVGRYFDALFGSEMNISGGTVSIFADAGSGSEVNICGGNVGDGFRAFSDSEVNISGGSVGDNFHAFSNSKINLRGTEFVLDGVSLDDSLTINKAFTIDDRDVILSGRLADGSTFSFDLNTVFPPNIGEHFFHSNAKLTVTRVSPKPITQPVQGGRPNIVMILVDDLGNNDLSSKRMPFTKGLFDRLGTSLKLYSNQSCAPTRAALMTGLNPVWFGQHNVFPAPINNGLPGEFELLPEHLQASGYRTGGFGKWHLGWQEPQIPINNGFDTFVGCVGGFINHYGAWNTNHYYEDGSQGHSHHGAHDMTNDGVPYYSRKYSTRLFRDHALTFLRKQNDVDPFFLYLPFTAPHGPYQAPRVTFNAVKSEFGVLPSDENYLNFYASDVVGLPTKSDAPEDVQLKLNRALYAAMVKELDVAIKLLWFEMVRKGYDKNTVFVFSSDNGGAPGIADNGLIRGHKGSPYQGGHRVANGIIAPWISPGQAVDSNIWFADLMPTFLEIANIERPKRLDGASALGALQNNEDLYRGNIRSFTSHVDKRYRPKIDKVIGAATVNLKDFKYIRQYEFDLSGTMILRTSESLYDLRYDPLEASNVFNNPTYENLRSTMRWHFDRLVGDDTMRFARTANVTSGIFQNFDLPEEWGAYPK